MNSTDQSKGTDTEDIREVDPTRLSHGTWSHEQQRQVGEGDISASYSGDTIAQAARIRRPFRLDGQLWVCVGVSPAGARAYRLVHPDAFEGETRGYPSMADEAETARNDPNGFYHGMVVTRGREQFVLCGPPIRLQPGIVEQPDLFDNLG